MAKITIRDLSFQDQRVLVRVDFNVPLADKNGVEMVTDDKRIRATLPTINYLLAHGARIILCAHLGRPKGKPDPKLSLAPVGPVLSGLLGKPVQFIKDCVGPVAEQAAAHLEDGEVILLENLRFHPQEEADDDAFSQQLAKLADIYVDDAFGTAHRAHSSTFGVTRFIKTRAIGFLMEKELRYLGDELDHPKQPFLVILGGAKVADKIKVINRLLDRAQTILIGGAMAYTFELAQGRKIGRSPSEPDQIDVAKQAIEKARVKGVKLLIPVDTCVVEKLDFQAQTISSIKRLDPGEGIPDGWEGVDIGQETIKLYTSQIATAKTIFWNGPMGVFEIKACAAGTIAIGRAVAANRTAISIVGGGDTVSAIDQAGIANQISFISTGGGASLEFLQGKVLPGVAGIPDKIAPHTI